MAMVVGGVGEVLVMVLAMAMVVSVVALMAVVLLMMTRR